jgi:polysaccharide export outer membrane protein
LIQLCSCVATKPPQFEYFQSRDPSNPALVETTVPKISVIQKGDILGIIVSTLNKESNEIINFPNLTAMPVSAFSGGSVGVSSQPLGFSVDSSGSVSMPIIGRQKVEGLTLEVAELKIRNALEKTLKEPSVNIRFMNHKFSVLGEVGKVGTFNLLDDHTTILDVLSASGDLTPYAKRDSVMIIRHKGNRREIGRINLRNRDVFKSPYFYIQNGDVVYVEPTKDKELPVKQLNQNFQRIPVYLSLFTVITSLILVFTR